ncbi:ATP-binding protein [Ferruginibacter sp. HRS2-29]|uniref:tetratricopeptide repeat-containing sensor histidine kinase n=1 Tax=Ferruginibacter sp. HRS2-29 TaxID=2487334 RepID=UPI0020CD1559|nr:ATP-binding protein [Ferruginibacter sp. HRS2-29]
MQKLKPATLRMVRRFLFTGLFVAYALVAKAQTATIEQCMKNVQAATSDEARLTALIRLCEEHASMQKDSLWKYAVMTRSYAAAQNNERKKSLAEVAVINACLRLGKTDSALTLIEPEILRNPLEKTNTRSIYFTLAAQKIDCFGDAFNYRDALSALYKIINEAEQHGDSLVLAKNMNTVGVIQYNLDHVPDAFSWYFKGISFTSSTQKFDAPLAALYINLAETYRWVEKLDSAQYYISKAIPLCERSENLFFLANAIRVKASIYKQLKQYDLAESTMLNCIIIREKLEGKLQYSNEQLALANIYMNAMQTDKAIKILTDALAQNPVVQKMDPLAISYYKSLAKCYKLKGDDKNYEETLEKLIAAKDAFYEENYSRSIAELQTKYEFEKKESTIIRQKLDLTQKNYLFYGSLITLGFVMTLSWLLFKNYRRRQKLAMDKALYKEKILSGVAVKEAEEKERKRIAADLHDNLGAYAASIVSNLDQIELQELNEATAIPLQELRNNSQAIVAQLGDTIWALKKDALSLTDISDRLKIFIQRVQRSYPQVAMDVEEQIENDRLLPPSQAFHLFSILQEAIINALKHSRCKRVQVTLTSKEQWSIEVADDGIGIDEKHVAGSNNGISNMQKRAAEFGWEVSWKKTLPGTNVSISPATTN